MIYVKFILIGIFGLVFYESSAQSHNHSIDSLETKLQRWRIDSLGCLGLRNNYHFVFWQELGHYLKCDTTLTLLLLGKPNEIKRFKGQIGYVYFYASKCLVNQIDDSLAPNNLIVYYTSENTFIGIINEER